MSRYRLRGLRTLFLFTLILLLPIGGRAIDLRLGEFTFAYPPPMSLVNLTPLSAGLNSYGYCNRIGGVAFGGVASGVDGRQIVGLKYLPEQPDGQRLQVTIAGTDGARRTVSASLYDWQLVPIAKFAAGQQHACFTLFGQLQNKADAQARESRGEKILNYHSAFANTLLGLRLFQADVLILYPQSADLPKENGEYVLGAGEEAPDIEANSQNLARVHTYLRELAGGPFTSYVICDSGVQITFKDNEGKLILTGDPVWQCWKRSTDDRTRLDEINAQANRRANEEGNRVLQEQFRKDRDNLSPEQLESKYTDAYKRQVFLPVFEDAYDRVMSRMLLSRMPEYSVGLSAKVRSEGGVNSAVYNALTVTMRYAALFRQVKQANPELFKAFVASLSGVGITPEFRTPSVLIGVGN